MAPISTALTALSLATGIAREAADGVPIVKQILGVASRVVGLAEHIEKNREDLHALVDRAKKMDAAISGALGDREPDDHMLRRLEDLNYVLRAIEQHFAKHVKRGRVRRALGYVFTVQKEVERLRGDFDDRLREIQVAANLGTSTIAREDARFIGELRNVRHCEIDLLDPIYTPNPEVQPWYDLNCHLATCEGSQRVFVVRYVVKYSQNKDVNEIIDLHLGFHDRMQEELSLIQNRHPAIAHLYGRNSGPSNNRFVVLNVGESFPIQISSTRTFCEGVFVPLGIFLSRGNLDLAVLGRIVARLVDVACHLDKRGAIWLCRVRMMESHLFLDERHEPKIGILDDIVSKQLMTCPASNVVVTLTAVLDLSRVSPFAIEIPQLSTLPSVIPWDMDQCRALIDAGRRTLLRENAIRCADIPNVIPLSQESRLYLDQIDEDHKAFVTIWGDCLLYGAVRVEPWEFSILRVIYLASRSGEEDYMRVAYFAREDGTMRNVEAYFLIPPAAAREVRERECIQVYEYQQEPTAYHLLEHVVCPGKGGKGRVVWCNGEILRTRSRRWLRQFLQCFDSAAV